MRLPLAAARINDNISVLSVQRIITRRPSNLSEYFPNGEVVLYRPFAHAELSCHNRHDKPSSAASADKPQKRIPPFVFSAHLITSYDNISGHTKNQPDNGLTFHSLFSFEKSPPHNIAIRGAKNRTPYKTEPKIASNSLTSFSFANLYLCKFTSAFLMSLRTAPSVTFKYLAISVF